MIVLAFLAALGVAVAFVRLSARLEQLQREIAVLAARLAEIEDGGYQAAAAPPPIIEPAATVAAHAEPDAEPQPQVAAPTAAIVAEPDDILPPPLAPPQPRIARPRPSFESIVGGKLPIWIGGAALVFAGFFLVRYSIELGLLGPAARTAIAGLFGLALIAAGEVAKRHRLTRDDPRIAQALAGAGVASLYGTLYVGAALYHLIGTGTAFALLVAVTLGALALALRHGPPTAIMALIGGFVAPLIAGVDATGTGVLLVYLALLVSALFGLAIRRGWAWLALAACGGGFLWVNILIALLSAPALPGVGAFVLLLAIGATLALPATGATRRWLRLAPLVAGLVQLLILAPALDFGPLAWIYYLVLSAAALALAIRDETLAPGPGAALLLILILLTAALDRGDAHAPAAAIATALLFGAAGHWRARRSPLWAGLALGATAAPLLLAEIEHHALLPAAGWAALLLIAAIAAAALSWRAHDEANAPIPSPMLVGGAAVAALLLGAMATELLPVPWRWSGWLALATGLAAASRRTGDMTLARLPLLPIVFTALAMMAGADRLGPYLASAVSDGATPPLADLVAIGLLPAALVAATAWLTIDRQLRRALVIVAWVLALGVVTAILPAPWHASGLALVAAAGVALDLPLAVLALAATALAMAPQAVAMARLVTASVAGDRLPYRLLPPLAAIGRDLALPAVLIAATLLRRPSRFGRIAWPVIAAAAIASLYALAKAPLHIDRPIRFTTWGFVERAAITQAFFLAAWLWRARLPATARALFWIALARFVWFDLLLLDPLSVPQSVGGVPILNAATIATALIACWLWQRREEPQLYRASLAVGLIALAVTVRQLTHGAFLTGPVGRTENWLYSAAGLLLALGWLWRGIATSATELRLAGLALLTLVTLKVFLIDAAALEGMLRILSFLGLGVALIGIGWAYGRMTRAAAATLPEPAP